MFNLNKENKMVTLLLVGIFLLAILLRFLYFPNNIYFGFDQARDAFVSQQILKGDLKIVGPPTGVEGWFHGPLYYYIWAPIYFFSQGNPEAVAAFLRIFNAVGVFLIFFIGTFLFNKWVGLVSSFLFAISFEQSQYALYFNHPSLAILTTLLFYLGLILLFFQKKVWGLVLAVLGLGLSLQFEFVLMYLFLIFAVFFIIYKKQLIFEGKIILFSALGLLLTCSTFFLVEVKSNFRSISTLVNFLSGPTNTYISPEKLLNNIHLVNSGLINDNLFSGKVLIPALIIILSASFIVLLQNKQLKSKLYFLLIWVLAGTLPYLGNQSATPLCYYSVGASSGLLIFVSFLLCKVWQRAKIISVAVLVVVLVSNIRLITSFNPKGSMPTINVQSGMLLSDEKRVIDYLYQESGGNPFSVNALTMPLYVNTTWSYLFQWYGQKKYNYLPVWGGQLAQGYPGNLPAEQARSCLPKTQFLIIEPVRGIRLGLIDQFMKEEGYFSDIVEEKKIGEFTVQRRMAK